MCNSDVSGFVFAIEAGDLNAVGSLFDWLNDRADQAARKRQFDRLDDAFGRFLVNVSRDAGLSYGFAFGLFLRDVKAIFWRDLATIQEAIGILEARKAGENPPMFEPEPEPPAYTGIAEGSVTCSACGTVHPPGDCPNVNCPTHPDHGQKCNWM